MSGIRYIKVSGEYESTGLWDETTYDQIDPRDLNLSADIVLRLDQLVRDYDPIVPLSGPKLHAPEVQEKIHAIDQRGMELAAEIATFLGEKYRVRYFSEGELKYL